MTLSASADFANSLKKNEEIALVDEESGTLMATMKVTEKYAMSKTDKEHECKQIFRTNDVAGHPGVQKVMNQPDFNLAGPVKVLSEAHFPDPVQGHLHDPGPDPQDVRGEGLEHDRRVPDPEPHAPLA